MGNPPEYSPSQVVAATMVLDILGSGPYMRMGARKLTADFFRAKKRAVRKRSLAFGVRLQ